MCSYDNILIGYRHLFKKNKRKSIHLLHLRIHCTVCTTRRKIRCKKKKGKKIIKIVRNELDEADGFFTGFIEVFLKRKKNKSMAQGLLRALDILDLLFIKLHGPANI